MKTTKRDKIKAAGFEVTDSADWLDLSSEERTIVTMRIALSEELDRVRKEKKISQSELAKLLGTKQPGVPVLKCSFIVITQFFRPILIL